MAHVEFYTPKMFQLEGKEEILQFMNDNAFAVLTCHSSSQYFTVHVPVIVKEVDGQIILSGHVAKANPIWKEWKEGASVHAMFIGPHCYISPRWYVEKGIVPTWNYTAVYASGPCTSIHDNTYKKSLLANLSEKYESIANPGDQWKLSEASMLDEQLEHIVAFEIRVQDVTAKHKLSQNRTGVSRVKVIEELIKRDPGSRQVAAMMIQREEKKSGKL